MRWFCRGRCRFVCSLTWPRSGQRLVRSLSTHNGRVLFGLWLSLKSPESIWEHSREFICVLLFYFYLIWCDDNFLSLWMRIPRIFPFRQRKTWNENSEFHLHPFNIRWLYSWRVDKICILLKSLRVLNSPSEQSWESFTSRTLCVLLL